MYKINLKSKVLESEDYISFGVRANTFRYALITKPNEIICMNILKVNYFHCIRVFVFHMYYKAIPSLFLDLMTAECRAKSHFWVQYSIIVQ